MARVVYVPGAEPPVNDGERRVIGYLEHQLPDAFTLFPGVQVVHEGRTDDIDLLILTPYALVVTEIKDIAGQLAIDNGACYVNDNLRPQPFIVTNAKARRLKSRMQEADHGLRDLWVAALVILAREPASLTLTPSTLKEGIMTLEDSVEKLTDPARLLPRPPYSEIGDLANNVKKVLNLSRGRERDVQFGPYVCTELVDRTSDEDVWSASHRVIGEDVEIRHIGRNPATRERRVREAEGELGAFATLSEQPWIDGPREILPQDDGSVALVYPPRQGHLLAELLEMKSDEIPGDQVILDVASAIAASHDQGITHGRLAPRWIEILPDITKVRGFAMTRQSVPPATQLLNADHEFLAPEVLQGKSSGQSADIFALGRLIGLLKPEDETMQALAERLTRSDPAERRVPADYIKRALAAAFGVEVEESGASADGVVLNDDGHLTPGSVIGSWVIGEHLGSGGFSNVYLARHGFGGLPRTVKVFKDTQAEDLVKHEFEILQDLDDPNVMTVIDAGSSEAGWYLVSEYLEGETLSQRVDSFQGTSNVGESLLIGFEILNALNTLHSQMVFHRDIKPENVILVEGRGAVLFDFGVAATDHRQIDGLSWPYWPPGVPAGALGPDPDLFALGVVMCELLTGEHPYPERNPHSGAPPDLSKLPTGLREVLGKAVSPDQAVRYTSATELRDALEPYVDTSTRINVSRRGRYRRVEQLIGENRLEEAETLCLPEWMRLKARIQRKRQDADPVDARLLAGLRVGTAQDGTGRIYALDGSTVDAKTWTYHVSGKPGLMIDVRIAEDEEGGVQIATIDSYDSADQFGQLVNRLRHGIYLEEPGWVMRLRYLVRPKEGRLGQRQATSIEELSDDAGIDVREALIAEGATAVGKRLDMGLTEPSREKNQVAVVTPENHRNEVALLAYLLTTVVPLARELNLLIEPQS